MQRGKYANNLLDLRLRKKMTQSELSRKSGVSRPIISDIENGTKKDIKISTLVALCDALGEKIENIFLDKKLSIHNERGKQ